MNLNDFLLNVPYSFYNLWKTLLTFLLLTIFEIRHLVRWLETVSSNFRDVDFDGS